ncbi:MAG TPA: GNAT family N-acetyltransferase [Candidatus Limnocylindria bacterium]|nr:GNAT family N-acetyltransferase [Candidatus Limnocylindria bacterium]
MPASTSVSLRELAPADYEPVVELGNRTFPDYPWSVEDMRHGDETWDNEKLFRRRLVAEVGGRIVGFGEIAHRRWAFVADKYRVDVWVGTDDRRQGIGSALYDALERTARERGARVLTGSTKEEWTDGVRFAETRGYREVKRDWESRLDVGTFDMERFAGAPARVAEQGIRIVTLAGEMARDGEVALQRAYDLDVDCTRDVPMTDAFTPQPFETWRKEVIEGPSALTEAFFIAVDRDGRYLGVSNLWLAKEDPTFLWQGLTGVRRDARGRGIAMALKLRTVEYARATGRREIKTWNDQRNRPMLRINEAMGFVKQPAWIEYDKGLAR